MVKGGILRVMCFLESYEERTVEDARLCGGAVVVRRSAQCRRSRQLALMLDMVVVRSRARCGWSRGEFCW